MDDELDKDSVGRQLADSMADARRLRAARDNDAAAADYPMLKAWQAKRLADTYADLLSTPRYAPAAQFFLDELYGPKDFRTRDEELARVVPIMVRILPARALLTLLEAVKLDTLSESLDTDMVLTLRRMGAPSRIDWPTYRVAYRDCGRRAERELQITLVGRIGQALDRLRRMRLIRISLGMMKTPAQVAGLGALHSFLEGGFDTFSLMQGADEFLGIVAERETALMNELFAAP